MLSFVVYFGDILVFLFFKVVYLFVCLFIFYVQSLLSPSSPSPATHLAPFQTTPGESKMSGIPSRDKTKPLPPCIKAEQGIPPLGMGSKMPVHIPGISPGPTSRASTNKSGHMTVTHIQRACFCPMSVQIP